MPEELLVNILAWGTEFVLENDNLWPWEVDTYQFVKRFICNNVYTQKVKGAEGF